MSKKVVINSCYGGFSISRKAMVFMASKGSPKAIEDLSSDPNFSLSGRDFDREDPFLIEAIETLGEKANGAFAKLRIVEIPDDVEYHIHEYDGSESIHENHRSWS